MRPAAEPWNSLQGMAEPDSGMTKFSLIRHGIHDVVDRVLVGRMAGVRLNSEGRDQARRIADSLCGKHIDSLQSSPQMRSQQTIEPLAVGRGLCMQRLA